MRFSKFIVITVIVSGIWFANKNLNIFHETGDVPDVLITAFYTWSGVELLAMAKMKWDERKAKKKEEEYEDKLETEIDE